jgi:hypothetical protein
MSAWIKFETATPDKPEVAIIAETLRIDPDEAVGKLLRVWAWADANTLPGQPVSVPESFIDRIAHRRGFAAAMIAAGWLEKQGTALVFPNFDRHNGTTAKARASTSRRVNDHRNRNAKSVTNVTPEPLPKPLPEKDIEKNPTDTPSKSPPSPDPVAIVALYPRRERTHEAIREVAEQLRKSPEPENLAAAMESGTRAAAAVIATMPSGPGNTYVPHALSFFRDRRYLDDPATLSRNGHKNGSSRAGQPLDLGGRKPATVIRLDQ